MRNSPRKALRRDLAWRLLTIRATIKEMHVSDSFAGQTVETMRRALAARLRQQGIDSAEIDARLLAGAAFSSSGSGSSSDNGSGTCGDLSVLFRPGFLPTSVFFATVSVLPRADLFF